MAVFGVMLSYILRAILLIVLRRCSTDMPRLFTSPFGQYGASVIAISAVTLFYPVQDPNFSKGVSGSSCGSRLRALTSRCIDAIA
jgi:ethanolamine permease